MGLSGQEHCSKLPFSSSRYIYIFFISFGLLYVSLQLLICIVFHSSVKLTQQGYKLQVFILYSTPCSDHANWLVNDQYFELR